MVNRGDAEERVDATLEPADSVSHADDVVFHARAVVMVQLAGGPVIDGVELRVDSSRSRDESDRDGGTRGDESYENDGHGIATHRIGRFVHVAAAEAVLTTDRLKLVVVTVAVPLTMICEDELTNPLM